MIKSINLSVNLDEYGKIKLNTVKKSDYVLEIEENEYIKGSIEIKKCEYSYVLSANIEIVPYWYNYARDINAQQGIVVELEMEEFSGFKGLAIERFNPFWTQPAFFEDFTKIPDNTQQVLVEKDSSYVHIMPISGASMQVCARAGANKNMLRLTAGSYFGGCKSLSGVMAVISRADNPYKAVEMSYDTAVQNSIIITPKKDKKSYPKELEGLGWCTWDAFYHDVTADKIEEKLKEFKSKDIPIKWIIIDDGWAMTKDFKLMSGYVDKEKFPDGLGNFIKYIKAEYGIEYVGIWHAFTGYWGGLDKSGQTYCENSERFTDNNSGLTLPGKSFESLYKFYSEWHKYLKEEGIDFLKVDTQGNGFEFYKNTVDVGCTVVNMHNALEESVRENFDSVMINCMGMGSMDAFSRKYSAVIRNSDDFMPNRENGFESHIMQNAYNAIFNDNLYFCDYDMWWTMHFSAKQSSVLRAISGGPVYISDEIGKTDKKYLEPIIDENFNVIRCDNAAKPTSDCIFVNPHDGVLKIFNTVGESFVVAAFNLSDKKKKAIFSLKDVYASGDYNMYRYFGKEYCQFKDGFKIEIEPGDVEIISLFKGEIKRSDKYISI